MGWDGMGDRHGYLVCYSWCWCWQWWCWCWHCSRCGPAVCGTVVKAKLASWFGSDTALSDRTAGITTTVRARSGGIKYNMESQCMTASERQEGTSAGVETCLKELRLFAVHDTYLLRGTDALLPRVPKLWFCTPFARARCLFAFKTSTTRRLVSYSTLFIANTLNNTWKRTKRSDSLRREILTMPRSWM